MLEVRSGEGDEMSSLRCPTCGSHDVININLTMEGGEQVSFFGCHQCEKRWWYKDGEPTALPEVLDLARRKKSPEPTS